MNTLFLLLATALVVIVAEFYLRRARKEYSTDIVKEIFDLKDSESIYQTIFILVMALIVFVLLLFKVELNQTNGLIFYIIFIVSYIAMYAFLIPKVRNGKIPEAFLKKYIIVKFLRIIAATLFLLLYFSRI